MAFAVTGHGPPLVVVPGWLSHLELDWAIGPERAFYEALSSGRTLVRYDRPGCGLSDPFEGPRSMASEIAVVRAVTTAIGVDRFDLFGWSLGAPVAAHWAAEHPETVTRLVLYGGWITGSAIGDPDSRRHVLGLLQSHWGLGSDLLTDVFAPDADARSRRALAQYQRASSTAGTAAAMLRLAYDLDVSGSLSRINTPTLVLHRDRDRAAPLAQGRELARGIPSARFVELKGRSHLPAFGDAQVIVDQVRQFLGLSKLRRRSGRTGLTERQHEVAALVANGLTNREIADRLTISERSAESHVERIRLRLGFRSRAQVAAWFVTAGADDPAG
ncbi:MAG: alpha/beta fold hydrolase [Tetrasphaera sp.]